jgi:hypothetical protein
MSLAQNLICLIQINLKGASNNPNSSKQKIITDTIPLLVTQRNNLMQTGLKRSSSLKLSTTTRSRHE